MLADELDFVVGVDPHRDAHAIVQPATGAALFEVQVSASERGYQQALRLAEREAPARRAWAIEGRPADPPPLARPRASGRTFRGREVFRFVKSLARDERFSP